MTVMVEICNNMWKLLCSCFGLLKNVIMFAPEMTDDHYLGYHQILTFPISSELLPQVTDDQLNTQTTTNEKYLLSSFVYIPFYDKCTFGTFLPRHIINKHAIKAGSAYHRF
jgi:hypothetical protein